MMSECLIKNLLSSKEQQIYIIKMPFYQTSSKTLPYQSPFVSPHYNVHQPLSVDS